MSLPPLPADYADARADLHAVAEQVLAAARFAAVGHIALAPLPGGFGTPAFPGPGGVDRVVRVDGVELVVDDETGEATNPFPEGNRMMISEGHESKFGQLPAADLAAYESGVRVLLGQIMAVSALPAHYVGITTANPASAEANRSAEASLTARAEARQQTFGPAWERVARLILAVEAGGNPSDYLVTVLWNDPATRSVAQEADAVVKLFQSGLLPQSYALSRLGYSDDEVREIRMASRLDALDRGSLPGAPAPAVSGGNPTPAIVGGEPTP